MINIRKFQASNYCCRISLFLFSISFKRQSLHAPACFLRPPSFPARRALRRPGDRRRHGDPRHPGDLRRGRSGVLPCRSCPSKALQSHKTWANWGQESPRSRNCFANTQRVAVLLGTPTITIALCTIRHLAMPRTTRAACWGSGTWPESQKCPRHLAKRNISSEICKPWNLTEIQCRPYIETLRARL